MSTSTVDRIFVAPKVTLSTPIVDRKHSVFLVFGSSEATETSALKIVGILVALKATVDRNVSSHC